MPNFDFKQFLVDMFQTPQGLLSFARAYGIESLEPAAVEKWFYRESIPAKWFIILLCYLAIENGEYPTLIGYLRGRRDVV